MQSRREGLQQLMYNIGCSPHQTGSLVNLTNLGKYCKKTFRTLMDYVGWGVVGIVGAEICPLLMRIEGTHGVAEVTFLEFAPHCVYHLSILECKPMSSKMQSIEIKEEATCEGGNQNEPVIPLQLSPIDTTVDNRSWHLQDSQASTTAESSTVFTMTHVYDTLEPTYLSKSFC
eukprot:Gb_28460 [translate_table: standard]